MLILPWRMTCQRAPAILTMACPFAFAASFPFIWLGAPWCLRVSSSCATRLTRLYQSHFHAFIRIFGASLTRRPWGSSFGFGSGARCIAGRARLLANWLFGALCEVWTRRGHFQRSQPASNARRRQSRSYYISRIKNWYACSLGIKHALCWQDPASTTPRRRSAEEPLVWSPCYMTFNACMNCICIQTHSNIICCGYLYYISWLVKFNYVHMIIHELYICIYKISFIQYAYIFFLQIYMYKYIEIHFKMRSTCRKHIK